jgi:chromosome segregation ATPase
VVSAIGGAFLIAFDQMDGVVMTNEASMATPVTRDELRDELTQLEQRVDRRFEQVDRRFEQVDLRFEQVDRRFEQVDRRFEQVDERLEHISGELTKMATKVELEMWGGALMACIEQSEKRLMMELARHAQANHEASRTLLAAIDDKYADLPGRVSRLEGAMFPDEPSDYP